MAAKDGVRGGSEVKGQIVKEFENYFSMLRKCLERKKIFLSVANVSKLLFQKGNLFQRRFF